MNNATLDSMLDIWAQYYFLQDYGIGFPHKSLTEIEVRSTKPVDGHYIPTDVYRIDKAILKLNNCERIVVITEYQKCGAQKVKADVLEMKYDRYRKLLCIARKKLKQMLD